MVASRLNGAKIEKTNHINCNQHANIYDCHHHRGLIFNVLYIHI